MNQDPFHQATPEEIYERRNLFINKTYYGKRQTSQDADAAFQYLMKNFLLYKDDLFLWLKEQEAGTVEEGAVFNESFFGAYYYMECFLDQNFSELSSENKKYAERFLELFSQTEISGSTYARCLLIGEISLGNPEDNARVAVKRLAAAVYALSTPWTEFMNANSTRLARIILMGYIPSLPEEERRKKAAIVLFRGFSTPSDYPLFMELGVDVVGLLRNELYPYFEKAKETYTLKNDTMEDYLHDLFFVSEALSLAARDICASIVPEEERTLKPFTDVAFEYFSHSENYPDLSNVDLDAVIPSDLHE